jgi:Domain of unknown function (DUF4114)/RTX calcium-binding nonapeptide repeat (4 copies)
MALIIGKQGNDAINGNDEDDELHGEEGDDIINGESGNDNLYGGQGSDTLNGGADNDTLQGDEIQGGYGYGKDILNGGSGNDIYEYERYTFTSDDWYIGQASGDVINDESGIDKLLLGSDNDTASVTPALKKLTLGEMGFGKDGTTLGIDLNKDGQFKPADDLSILNFFTTENAEKAGTGFIENVSNLSGTDILRLFLCPDTSPLVVKVKDGKFADVDSDGDCDAQGTILIGREDGIPEILRVENAKAEISEVGIKITGGTVYSSIYQISKPLFQGNFTIPIGTVSTSSLQETLSLPEEFKLAGLDIDFNNFNLASNQIQLQGKITLPERLSKLLIEITGDNKLVVSENGFELTGSPIPLPDGNLNYDNFFNVKASGLNLGWSKDYFKIQGKVEGSSSLLLGAEVTADFTSDKYIKISDKGIDVKGQLLFERVPLVPGKWELNKAGLQKAFVDIDTVEGNVTGKANIQLPWGLIDGIGGELSFIKRENAWQLNSVEIETSGNLPLPILPVINLNKVKGRVINLAEQAQDPITFNGAVTFTAKPLALSSITTILPDWVGRQFNSDSVGKFTLGGSLDEDRLLMDGNVNFLDGLLSGSVNELEIDWNNLSLNAQVNAKLLNDFISLDAGFTANSNFDFIIFGEGKVTIPNIEPFSKFGLSGEEILSAGAGVKFINNKDLSDDTIAGWGSILSFTEVGYQVSLSGEVDIIGAEIIESYKQKTLTAEGSISLDNTSHSNQFSSLSNYALSQVLVSVLPITYSYLQTFATAPDFNAAMNLAFGNSWDKTIATQLAQAWASSSFNTIPTVEILPAANIGGANAAFADATDTIYLAKEYLTYHASDLNSIANVLLEEIGHWVDTQINSIDASGDEGAIFSSLVRHQPLSEEQLAQLKAEDDTLSITIDGTTTELNLNFSQEDSFSIAPDTPWLLLAVNWVNNNSSVPVELQAPDGKIFTEADIANSQTISLVGELGSSTRKVVRIDKPKAGIWKIKLADTSSLGQVEFSALSGLKAPQMKITDLTQEPNSSNVIINYEISNIDANAQVSFYYDDNNQGFDGILIGEVNPQTEGTSKFVWNTKSIDPSQYYVYALVFDGNRIPTSAYSITSVGQAPIVNQAPINKIPSSQKTTQNAALIFATSNGNLITITDPTDANDSNKDNKLFSLTLVVDKGTLTLAGTSGLNFVLGDGTADSTMNFTGKINDINTALNGLSFFPTTDFSGNAQLTITTKYEGVNGTTEALSDTDTVLIAVETSISNNPFLKQLSNNLFQIEGDKSNGSRPQLQITLKGTDSNTVNELGVFAVDDTNGNINSIAPGSIGYVEAALKRAKVIFSAITNIPNGFNVDSTSLLEFDSDTQLGFFLIKNGSIDSVLSGITSKSEVLFSQSSTQKVEFLQDGRYLLNWEDGNGSSIADFNDLVVEALATNKPLPLGIGVQGNSQGEVIDLRSVTGRVQAEFTLNREAAFNNFVGLYKIVDDNGGIDINGNGSSDLLPGDAGYIEAAVRGRISGIDLTVNNQSTATFKSTLEGGSLLAPFLIVNGKPDAMIDNNPDNNPNIFVPFQVANPGRYDHIRLLGNNKWGFEDLPLGGDKDYNDVVMQASFSRI